jgi:hypothetical protein
VTRRLPEGPWDPKKIPRIQILMSRDVFLVRVGGPPFPQLEGQIGRTRSVHAFQLDGADRSHNPKVGGSNPPPATKESAEKGHSSRVALLLLLDFSCGAVRDVRFHPPDGSERVSSVCRSGRNAWRTASGGLPSELCLTRLHHPAQSL